MRLFSKVLIFVLLSLVAAFLGSWFNSTYYEKISVNDVMAEAALEYKNLKVI